ncbi:MAG: DUF488 domain-containing protein [Myxococcales bacterium]|nr:MAG: DUF488 domain-containing protein [Myxococcales bacterium]
MIDRQRILLDLIGRARGNPKRTQLMKWLFLLKEETAIGKSVSFYEFVPYKYGPFSFLAYRELSALCQSGVVDEKTLSIPEASRETVRSETAKLSHGARQAVAGIVDRYGALSLERLMEDVYNRYPWYTVRSEVETKAALPKAKEAVFTVGYEGRTIDGLLDHLLKNGIRQLVDVRQNALSRKYGFSGKTLRKYCEDVGISYVHLPSLGIPSRLRTNLDSDEAYVRLFDKYERDILPKQAQAIREAAKLSLSMPSALMCFEKDHHFCHRGRLVSYVASEAGLPVEHL